MSVFRKKHEEPEDEGWLMTYADAITQLMCFFLLLLSVSQPIQSKFEEAKKGMKEEFSGKEQENKKEPFIQMEENLTAIIDRNKMNMEMGVGKTDKGVQLELANAAFFKPGSAEFTPDAEAVLEEIVKAVVNFALDFSDYQIAVEGHTDDTQVSNATYPSNWELSAARASSVVRFFQDKGVDADRLIAIGMGSAYPKVPNVDEFKNVIPENQEANRRVVVKIERKD